jgi:hypothetical protein
MKIKKCAARDPGGFTGTYDSGVATARKARKQE